MRTVIWISLCLVLGMGLPLQALEVNTNTILSADEAADQAMNERRSKAAGFRVARAKAVQSLPADYHQQAAILLAQAQGLQRAGKVRAAWELANRGYDQFQYSDSAAGFLHILFRYFAATGRLETARNLLIDLWERYPDYEGGAVAMKEALTVAENNQRNFARFDLTAATPGQVVEVLDIQGFLRSSGILRFLAQVGDQREIAPRAALGLARAKLIEGGKKKVVEARVAYDAWLGKYADHPLVFDALTELCIAYLVTYRGAKYDVGVLIDGASVIDLAELYSRERPERIEMIRRYRSLIRGWHQDRDLYAAGWYREKGYLTATRFYLEEVIARDPESGQGREAALKLSELPEGEKDSGTPLFRVIYKHWFE